MKKLLLISSLFTSVLAFSQDQPHYLTAEGGLEFSKNATMDVGLHFGGGLKFANHLYAGANAGLMKFSGKDKVSVPLSLSLRYMRQQKGKVTPFYVLEPGYHVYNNTQTIGTKSVETKGGFCLYGGGGIICNKVTFGLGYSQYDFAVDGLGHTEHRITAKIGILLGHEHAKKEESGK